MAQVTATLTFETDNILDAVSDIEHIIRALAKCHGQEYRLLERDIERLADGALELTEPEIHDIGGGYFVIETPPAVVTIIADARRMGII